MVVVSAGVESTFTACAAAGGSTRSRTPGRRKLPATTTAATLPAQSQWGPTLPRSRRSVAASGSEGREGVGLGWKEAASWIAGLPRRARRPSSSAYGSSSPSIVGFPTCRTISSRVGHRSPGSFWSIRSTAAARGKGISGRTSRSGAGVWWVWAYISPIAVSAPNGVRPVSIS